MKNNFKLGIFTLSITTLISCGSGGSSSSNSIDENSNTTPEYLINPVVEREITFDFDPSQGIDLYTALENSYGVDSIQAPGIYENNHFGINHLTWEVENSEPYLKMILHIEDNDRDTTVSGSPTRQRNEVSIINDDGRCFYGQTMSHKFDFYIENDTHISSSFSHFMQFLNNTAGHAALSLTGRRTNGIEELQILYTNETITDDKLASIAWNTVEGQWLSIHVAFTCAEIIDGGNLYLTINDSEGKNLIAINRSELDMWHGERGENDFLRMKYGYYRKIRSSSDSELLTGITEETESVRFKGFIHQKLLNN